MTSHESSRVAADAQERLLAIITLVRWLQRRKMAEAQLDDTYAKDVQAPEAGLQDRHNA